MQQYVVQYTVSVRSRTLLTLPEGMTPEQVFDALRYEMIQQGKLSTDRPTATYVDLLCTVVTAVRDERGNPQPLPEGLNLDCQGEADLPPSVVLK
jgi:hypothetical protein